MIITNGNLITWESPNRILENHAILIDGGRIKEIGPSMHIEKKHPTQAKLDAGGKFVMPGLICAHTHFYGAFSRGMAISGDPPDNFMQILKQLWWPLDRSLDKDGIRYSAYVCILDAIQHGATTLMDHHASPNMINGSLDVIADVIRDTGVRASLSYEVSDRGGVERAQEGINENVRFINRVISGDNLDGRLSALFGLHASLTVGDRTLEKCREMSPFGAGFHVHVAEYHIDQYDSVKKSKTRVVDRLNRFGILGTKTLAVHAVHVDAKEIQLLADTGTWVTHQPRSNMNNAVGLPMVEAMIRSGVKVGIGNDGFSNTMWDEWKTTYLAHKLWTSDPRRMNGEEVIRMGAYNNSELASAQFNAGDIGKLVEGAQADIIFVDYKPFTELTPDNLPWHILFGFNESMITTTIVAGKVLMDNRTILFIDEKEVIQKAREAARKTWNRYIDQV